MNAPDEKLRSCAGRKWPVGAMAAMAMLAVGVLGGCADLRRATTLPPVNPESPVAAAVAGAAMRSYPRPSLASVPPKPLNIPPPDSIKTAVIDMVRCRRAYEVWAAAHPAQVSGTVAFAQTLQAGLDNNPEDRPTPADEAASEAEAARLRAYAAPPPPLPAGPPLNASEAAAPGAIVAAPSPRPTAPAKAAVAASGSPASPARAPVALPAAPEVASAHSAAPPTPAPSAAVAVVQPANGPLFEDPVLAYCQGVGL